MTEPTDDERKQAVAWHAEQCDQDGHHWVPCLHKIEAYAHGLADNRLRAEKAEAEMVAQAEKRGAAILQLGIEKGRATNAERLLLQARREWTPTQGPTDQWLRDAKALLPTEESEKTDD